jgi:hypothetical protein
MTIQDTLNEREARYGQFGTLAPMIQALKRMYRAAPSWQHMTDVQREVMDMDVVKTLRILYGDPHHADNWHDKAGYAMLAHEELVRMSVPPADPVHVPRDLDQDPVPAFLTKEKDGL